MLHYTFFKIDRNCGEKDPKPKSTLYKPFLLFLWDWVWKNAASHSSWCGEVKNGWWRVLFELGEKSPRVLGRRPHNAREKETMLNETNVKTKSLFGKCFLGTLSFKKNGKKGDIVRTGGRGVNPSSFYKPKFTGFSNHTEMDFWHHNMSLKSLRNRLLTPHYESICSQVPQLYCILPK